MFHSTNRGRQACCASKLQLDRNGHVLAHSIARSSGYADLDNEVMAMIMRAEPLPPFPASMTQARIDLTVPIQFSLSGTAFAQERQHPAGCSLEINQQRRASIGNNSEAQKQANRAVDECVKREEAMRQAENLAQVRRAAEEAAKKAEALQHLKTDAAEAAIEDNKEGGCRHQQQVWKAYTSKGYTSTSLHETISRALNECQQQEYQRASLEEAKQAIGAPNFRVEVLSNTFESHMVAPAHKEYMEPVCVEVYGHAPECHQGSYIVSPDYSTSGHPAAVQLTNLGATIVVEKVLLNGRPECS
jgi:TonB family protein